MTKSEKPKSDNFGWIMALLFPKRGKPTTQPTQKSEAASKPSQPAITNSATPAIASAPQTATASSSPAPQQLGAIKAPAAPAPQIIHSVAAPPVKPAPIQPATKQEPPVNGQAQATKLSPKSESKKSEHGKVMPTIWTVASILSLIVNVILIVVLLVLGRELFVLKSLVGEQLLGGLYQNFIYMDLAHIKTEITVKDTIPISFTLPISQDTVVTLTNPTPINGANVRIVSGGLTINSPANIILPAGTSLPVHLELNVPVQTTVPVTLKVPVDIPLDQTELHKPFIGLQQVVDPFYKMLFPQYKKPSDVPACQSMPWLCNSIFANP
jgi:hypothetical protein